MNKILLLYDHRGFISEKFVGTAQRHTGTTMDIRRLEALFSERGFEVESTEVSRVDFSRDYSGWYVLYASSEDPGMFYKDFFGDVLCALERRNAVLIPAADYFRAHSNKSYQEMLRRGFADERLRRPAAISVGRYEELPLHLQEIRYPAVVKVSNGAGSKGVVLVSDQRELLAKAKKLMTHTYRDFSRTPYVRAGLFIKRFLRRVSGRRVGGEVLFPILRTNKIIIEEYISGLSGDSKVLYFYGKYFVLMRQNRDNDFRASGSGRFSYSDRLEDVKEILDMARCAAREIKMPILSLDIGKNAEGCFLLEYQCVHFGPYTLQYAPSCYTDSGAGWETEAGPFDLEAEYVRSISDYILAEAKES